MILQILYDLPPTVKLALALILASPIFWSGLQLVHKGLLHWILPQPEASRYWWKLRLWRNKESGYREWYRIVFDAADLEEQRNARHWHSLHNGQPYREFYMKTVKQFIWRERVLALWIDREPQVRFATAADAPAGLRQIMNASGYVADTDGRWVLQQDLYPGRALYPGHGNAPPTVPEG